MVGVAADGREVLIDAYDGRSLWTGADGERVVAADSRHALIRSADRRSVSGLALGAGEYQWSYRVHPKAQAALARYAAVIVDRDPDKVIALDPDTGAELLAVRTSAKVVAVGPSGLILLDRRELGYIAFTGAAGDGEPADDAPTGDQSGGAGPVAPEPTCSGPKKEQCPPGEDG
jgi:hypothetical protein